MKASLWHCTTAVRLVNVSRISPRGSIKIECVGVQLRKNCLHSLLTNVPPIYIIRSGRNASVSSAIAIAASTSCGAVSVTSESLSCITTIRWRNLPNSAFTSAISAHASCPIMSKGRCACRTIATTSATAALSLQTDVAEICRSVGKVATS